VYLEPAVLLDVLYSVFLVSEPLSRVVPAKLLHDCHGSPKQEINSYKTGYLIFGTVSKMTQFCDRHVNMHTEMERGSIRKRIETLIFYMPSNNNLYSEEWREGWFRPRNKEW
jgi:hypothetical protein